jgi:ribosomal protein S18 acetylase RimI-like enzyme
MAVDENFRRKGIAKQLTQSALNKAAVLGATKVILYTQTGLRAAVELYRKTGFREVPMETEVYKRSDIKMEIEL